LPLPVLILATWRALRGAQPADWVLQPQPGLLAAGLVPWAWYAVFTGHTATHSLFMVRPLALDVALAIVAVMLRRRDGNAVRDHVRA
jgi:hypothetical protein